MKITKIHFNQLIILISLPLLFSCKEEGPVPVELISNGNLEEDVYGNVKDWTFINEKNNPYHYGSWSSDQSYSSLRSLAINSSQMNTSIQGYSFYYQEIFNIPAEKRVTLRAKVKGEDITPTDSNPIAVYILCEDIFKQVIAKKLSNDSTLTGDFDWKDLSVEMTIPKYTARLGVFLMLSSNVTGKVYFDDVSFSYLRKPE